MTEIRRRRIEKVTLRAEFGRKTGKNRPRSVENFYASAVKMCINPQNPTVMGVLPPISVDNHVENVDFPVEEPVHIHSAYTFFRHTCSAHVEN